MRASEPGESSQASNQEEYSVLESPETLQDALERRYSRSRRPDSRRTCGLHVSSGSATGSIQKDRDDIMSSGCL
jgi:hypothetical protein